MKLLTTLSTCALIALAVPAFAQSNPSTSGAGTNSSQPNGNPGATGGTDPKNGMSEGRSSATDSGMKSDTGAMKSGAKGANPATNNNMAPGGGPGETGK